MWTVFLLMLPSVLAAEAVVVDDPALDALNLEVRIAHLPNGLTVLVREDNRAPLVATSVLYRVGEPDGEETTGFAHLAEHLMFRGSPNAPDKTFEHRVVQMGGTTNAWTSHDWTVFQSLVSPPSLEMLLFLESDRMGWLAEAIREDALHTELEVLDAEHAERSAGEHARARQILRETLWPEDHPYHTSDGTVRSGASSPTLEEIQAYISTWFTPTNAVLSIVGNVDATQTLDMAHRIFQEIPLPNPPPGRPYPPPIRRQGEQRFSAHTNMPTATLVAGWNTVPKGHPDEAALTLLGNILADGRGTRLVETLVHEERNAREVRIQTQHRRLGGEFLIQVQAKRSLDPVLFELDKEIRRIQAQPPTPEELQRATALWRTRYIRSVEELQVLADSLSICMATHDDAACLKRDLERILQVEPGDIQAAARTYLGPDRVLVSLVPQDDERFALAGSERASP